VAGKKVFAKIGRQRKPRIFISFRDNKGQIYAQAEDAIIEVLDEETGLCIYNLNGGYFPYLRPELGAKIGIFPKKFIEILKSTEIKPGEELADLGGCKVYFGGCITI